MSRAPFSTSYQNQNQSFSPLITPVLIGSLHSLLWGLLLVWVYNRQLKLHSKSSEVNYNSTPRVFLWREIPGPFSREARNPSRKFWNQNMLNSSTVPSSQTGQFCFVNWWLHCLIFKVIETLILNANTTNVKELFGPEKLSGLSRKGPRTVRWVVRLLSASSHLLCFLLVTVSSHHSHTHFFLSLLRSPNLRNWDGLAETCCWKFWTPLRTT